MTVWDKLHKMAAKNDPKSKHSRERSRRNQATGGKKPRKQGGKKS